MATIHSTAVVHPSAEIATDVEIGPYCVVGEGAVIGKRCRLGEHVVVKSVTQMGSDNRIEAGAVLGGLPQHASPPGPAGGLRIGDNNLIREHVTMHRSLYADQNTVIGSNGLFMVGSHVAHDCQVGNKVILANHVLLAGHVQVGDQACFGGASAVQQFCRVGRLCMIGGMARLTRDAPPFMTIDGGTTKVVGLNLVGLRRADFSESELSQLKSAYRVLYRGGLSFADALQQLDQQFTTGVAAELVPFIRAAKHGIVQERRAPRGAVLRVFEGEARNEMRKVG